MPGRGKPLITRNGIPDPQAYNPQTGQWESFIGVSWGKTAGGLYVPIRVDDQGRQEVTLSGTTVEQGEVARDVIVTPGSEVIAYTDNNKLAAVALSVVVNAKTPHNFVFRVVERIAEIPGYSSIYFDTTLPSEGKVIIAMPKKALSANRVIQYRIRNSSDIDQSYAIARGLWYV